MSEQTVVTDDIEANASATSDTGPEAATSAVPAADTDTDLLVEEVSIDGMCGVY